MLTKFDAIVTPVYPPPRKNVLLLSCMDLRMLDDTVRFMNRDNLANRYDHFILAGASLGAEKKPAWKKVFFEHLKMACDLHDVHDVYILEHRNCGAYEKFLGDTGIFGDSLEEQAREWASHRDYALKLADKVKDWATANSLTLGVRCFLMDLRGDVAVLSRPDEATPAT